MRAGFSARHVSFIETGRTQPSRQALLILAETLDVPLRERNKLLEAGGYAHIYKQTPLAAEAMRHVRGVLEFILQRHEPYGAMVLDTLFESADGERSGRDADERARRSVADGAAQPAAPPNVLRLVFHPLGSQRFIVNRHEVLPQLLARAEREMGELSGDETAAALLAELRGYVALAVRRRASQSEAVGRGGSAAAGALQDQWHRPAAVQHDHDARHAAGRHAAGAPHRDVLSSGRGIGSGAEDAPPACVAAAPDPPPPPDTPNRSQLAKCLPIDAPTLVLFDSDADKFLRMWAE